VATAPPAARIEGLTVDDVPVPPDQRDQLGPAVGRLAIRYTALSLTDAASLHFRYRLQPGIIGWTETGDREMATYRLPAGDYRFEVQASFDRGRWPESGSQIEFTVLPRWYETWWARGGLLLFALGLLVGAPLLRIRVLRRHAHTLAEQVAARTRELRAANNQLVWMARTDALTGISNRRHFDQHLAERLSRPDLPLALLMADVDAFKAYNDRHGHLAGDDCLQQVVQALVAATPSEGALLARFGGEEFVLLLEGDAAVAAAAVAERLLQAVRELGLEHPDGPAGTVTISVGYALRSNPAESADDLFRRADQAMYRAKAEGRNCVRADPAP
jgi:diguanylate cyclase (GGDEF)-like protein